MKTFRVKRGFEMRFHPEEYFDEVLYPIPKGVELYDDVYYIDYGDGQPLRECYNRTSSEKYDMYQRDEPWEDTVEWYEEQSRIFRESLPKAPEFKRKFNNIFK